MVIGGTVMLLLTVFSARYSVEKPAWGSAQIAWDTPLFHVMFAALSLGFAYLLGQYPGRKDRRFMRRLTGILAVGVTALLFWLITCANAVPQADQEQVYWATRHLLEGNYSAISNNEYYQIYPFQLPLAQLQAWLFSLPGTDVVSGYRLTQYLNALLSGATFYLGGCITDELFANSRVQVCYLLTALPFLPLYIYALFQYGDAPGVFFCVLSVYLYLRAERERGVKRAACWIGNGLALTLVYLIRSALLTVWIAMFMIIVINALRTRRVVPIAWFAGILAICVLGQGLVWSSITQKTGIDKNEGEPLILCVAMGMQGSAEISENPGSYNGYNWDTFRALGKDREMATRQAYTDMREKFSEWEENPGAMAQFYKSKLFCQWLEPSCSAFSSTNKMDHEADWVTQLWFGKAQERVYGFLNLYQTFVYLLLAVYFLAFLKNPRTNALLPGLILVGGFLLSIVWESQSRYTYPYLSFALPGAACGMNVCLKGIGQMIQKARNHAVRRVQNRKAE